MNVRVIQAGFLAALVSLVWSAAVQAAEASVTLYRISAQGAGAQAGTVMLRDSEYGMLVIPDLHGLKPGPHATHVHEHPDCGPATKAGKVVPGAAAGGHYDPHNTGQYSGPYARGAVGDLPNLIIEHDGTSTIPVLAPRMTVGQARGRSLMIHQGADRYGPRLHEKREDAHAGHAHGGMRMYCGVIK